MTAPAVSNPEPKRLYLDGKKGILGGVCAGLADYFGIDVTLVRVVFAVLTVLTVAVMALVYLVMWIVIPVRPQDAPEPSAPLGQHPQS